MLRTLTVWFSVFGFRKTHPDVSYGWDSLSQIHKIKEIAFNKLNDNIHAKRSS